MTHRVMVALLVMYITFGLSACGGQDYLVKTVEDDSGLPTLGVPLLCTLPSDPPFFHCPSGERMHTVPYLQWYAPPDSEEWRPAIRAAMLWWKREIGVPAYETERGPGMMIGWHDDHYDNFVAHAHRDVEITTCEPGLYAFVKIDRGTLDVEDVPLLIHEVGHTLGYLHDERGTVMHRYHERTQRACGYPTD